MSKEDPAILQLFGLVTSVGMASKPFGFQGGGIILHKRLNIKAAL